MNNSKRKYILDIISDFSHDLFTGLAICCLGMLFWIKHYSIGQLSLESLLMLNQVGSFFSLLFLAALGVIFLTGIIRLQDEKVNDSMAVPQEYFKIRKGILIIKHIILGAFFLIGGYMSIPFLF